MPRKYFFRGGGGVGKRWILPKMAFVREIEKQYLALMIYRSVLATLGMWGGFSKDKQHYKIGKVVNLVSSKIATPLQKGGCWNGCEKGVSLPVMHKNCVLLKTLQQNTAIAEKRV